MAQPLDPMRLHGTMLDTRKVSQRNREKTGKEQRQTETLAIGGSSGQAAVVRSEPMEIE